MNKPSVEQILNCIFSGGILKIVISSDSSQRIAVEDNKLISSVNGCKKEINRETAESCIKLGYGRMYFEPNQIVK